MPGCSKKKAELIIQNRPYKTWETLVGVFFYQLLSNLVNKISLDIYFRIGVPVGEMC